jgi:UDP:flavonoid glycosyltransferase YjiC (YdhE family)
VISHADLNTTLKALGCWVPVLAIPITNEQTGIAARLASSRAGGVIPVQELGVANLRELVSEMLSDLSYKTNAQRLQSESNTAGGVAKLADLIAMI